MPAQHELGLFESAVTAWAIFTILGLHCATSVWVIDRDMRRLPPAMLERAYSVTSFAAAIFAGYQLGNPQIAVLVHFVRTRRSIWGVLQGVLWVVVAYLPGIAFAALLDLVMPG